MSALEKGYRVFGDLHWAWFDKVVATTIEKTTTLECLQAAIDQEKEAVEREKKKEEEIFQLKAKLELACIDLESAHFDLVGHRDLRISSQKEKMRSQLALKGA